MKIVAGYLLLVLGGNATPSATDLKSLLSSVGAEAADEMIDLFLSNVSGKDITELIASGREKLASVPSGGGVALTTVEAAAASYDAAPADAPAEAKKEEIAEEEDDDLGFSLFDD